MAYSIDESYRKQVKKLNSFYFLVKHQLLDHQSPTIGLFPLDTESDCKEACVRESVYCAVALWALGLAYRKIDDDDGRTYELEQSAVKCMRGILYCYMRQASQVEKFKYAQSEENALHTYYHLITGDTLDSAEHHLQIDAVALYLLYLVQMISSGLQIIYTLDEVSFVQNLVFYIERAYRIPDFGMWGRGSKYNTGKRELNASSIGMAKAALEACNGFNFFGKEGTSWSITYIDPDSHGRNRTIIESLLPRESSSKNTDASLLATISFPAFALDNDQLRKKTLDKVLKHCKGRYGFRRFLRDGYGSVLEDKNRKYYQPAEVKNFDGIENQWPIFFIFMMLDGLARKKPTQVDEYYQQLRPLLRESKFGHIVPKYFYVPETKIDKEKAEQNTQDRIAWKGDTEIMHLWGQALYLVALLLKEELIEMSELDPLGRYLPPSARKLSRHKHNTRHPAFEKTTSDMTIQMVFVAESARLQSTLATYGIQTQTPSQLEPIQIWSPAELIKALQYLGHNEKLGLTGRPPRPIGSIGTAKIYRMFGSTVLCYPLQFEASDFYMYNDMSILVDDIKSLVSFVRQSWTTSGRPTFCILLKEELFEGPQSIEMLEMLAMFKRGNYNGIRVKVDRLQTLISASFVEHLDFKLPEDSVNMRLFQQLRELEVDTIPLKTMIRKASSSSALCEQDEEIPFDIKEIEHKSTWEIMQTCQNYHKLSHHAEILHLLSNREGLHFVFEGERLEAISEKARLIKDWSTLRYCASVQRKHVDSLAPSVTAMLVRGKFISIGVFGHEEELIMRPVSPNFLIDMIFNLCHPYDMWEAVMQQEMIINLSKLISNKPELFTGMLKVRVGWLLQAMRTELKSSWKGEQPIHTLSPSKLKELMQHVLKVNMTTEDNKTWLQKRQFLGSLNRTPANFFDRVWMILSRTPGGFIIANYYLPQQPTVSDMTKTDLNFALRIEEMFRRIAHPEYKQIMIESLSVLATILERNDELQFQHTANMDNMIHEAFNLYLMDNGFEKQDDMTPFYNTPPHGVKGTGNYLAKVLIKHLLNSPMDSSGEKDPCIVS